MGEWVEIINNVGFPIVVAGALFYQNIKQNETYQTTMNQFSKVIDKNTETIDELIEQMKGGK